MPGETCPCGAPATDAGLCTFHRCYSPEMATALLRRQRDRIDALERARPDDLRAAGWTVAVHNDYRLAGASHTFWILTHPSGRYLKGEGRTDVEALDQIRAALQEGTR